MMFTNACRLAVVCTLCIFATAVQDPSSFRLIVGDGGYARLLKPAPSLGELTLAGWVNVTKFPNGVAPILTAVARDAQSQVAFFLRHDGVGVLWGGPKAIPQIQMDQVDRHPRTQWMPMEIVQQRRKRRDAVDYSGGLGDIENILADPRSGRSFTSWTPQSFVDVDTMGVADLEASPSDLNADIHLLPTRDGFARSESYNDWKIVPYELAMQESSPQDRILEPEPRIITEPSGDDDFVFFNWNVPQPPKPSIPQSPNEWSPMWQSDKDQTESASEDVPQQEDSQNITQPSSFNWPQDNPGGWSSQVEEVKLGPNHWNPYRITGAAFSTPRPIQQQRTTQRPITTHPTTVRARTTSWPTRAPAPLTRPTPARPSTPQPSIPRITTTRSVLRWRNKQPIITPTKEENKFQFDISQFTIPPSTTTTQKPQTREQINLPSAASSTRQSTRMPLWKLIKQPGNPHASIKQDIPTTSSTTAKPPSTTTTTTTRQPTTARTTTRYSPRTPPARHAINHPRPLASHTLPEDETEKPQITGQKSKVSIWTHAPDTHKPTKEFHHEEKWGGNPQASLNTVSKHRPISITPYHVQEFQRAMEGLPTVKDGDTAVVYSVPITDVDAFNAMYKQYQSQAAPKTTTTTKAPIIIHREIVHTHEDETNENQLDENNLLFKDTLSYQFPNETESSFDETASPAILTEEEAVLIATEEPLPPTPSRSDIPIAVEAESSWIPSVAVLEGVSHKHPSVPYYEDDDYVNEEDQFPSESIISPQTLPEIPFETAPSTTLTAIQDIDVSTVQAPNKPEEKYNIKPFYGNIDLVDAPASSEATYRLPDPSLEAVSVDVNEKNEDTVADIQEKIEVQTTTPEPRPTSVRVTLPPITTNEKTTVHPITQNAVIPNQPSGLESNNFAVFHISEDDIPIYPGQEETAEDVYSVDKLYQAEPILATQEDNHPISYYQEPSHLYHQQLPPEYKDEEAPRPIAYSGPLKAVSEPSAEEILLDGVQFSADPQDLLEQGLLPQPVHYVNSQEEADEWMQDQYEQQDKIEDRVFNVDASDTVNRLPLVHTHKVDSEGDIKPELDAHFKKLPHNFLPNQWYHLAFTWSGHDHKLSIYINGELAGTLDDVLPMQLALPAGGLTILGQTLLPDLTDFDHTSQFIGEMSDINMFGRRLRPEAVRALYHCRTRVSASPALGWHHLSMRFYSNVYIQESTALCGA